MWRGGVWEAEKQRGLMRRLTGQPGPAISTGRLLKYLWGAAGGWVVKWDSLAGRGLAGLW